MDASNLTNCSETNFTNKTCFEFSKHDFESIIWANAGVSMLAAATSSLVLMTIVFFKAFKKFVHRLVLYLNIAVLANSIVTTLEVTAVEDKCGYIILRNEDLCMAVGALAEYSMWVLQLIVCWITVHLFVLAVLKRNNNSLKYEIGGIIVCLAVPIPFFIVPFLDFKIGILYGLSGAWCWIKTTNQNCHKYEAGEIEQFTLWYGPLVVIVTMNFLAMFIVIIVLCKGTREADIPNQLRNQYKKALKESLPLLFYPILADIIVCLTLINRVFYVVTKKTTFGIWVENAVAHPCLLLFIPLAFLLHPYTLKKLNCLKLRKAARKWGHHSERSHTHFVVSRQDTCDTEQQTLIVRGSEGPTSGYQSFLDIPTNTPSYK